MSVKPHQNWIIKSACLYPVTGFLWILDFILYNWKELSAKKVLSANKLRSTGKYHNEESVSNVDELIDRSLRDEACKIVIKCYTF